MSDCSVTSWGEQTVCGLSCHILDICNTRLLLECPLNVSSSLHFLPAEVPPRSFNGRLDPGRFGGAQSIGKQTRDAEDQPLGGTSWRSEEKLLPPFKRIHGQVLIDDEPWYKLADIGTLDWSSIDAVLISNPQAMLGLPYLMQEPNFLAKVYVTEAAAKLGKLLMEELVAMHESYVAQFGITHTARPRWLEPGAQRTLVPGPQTLLGNKGWDSANWHQMYNAEDLNLCMKRLHCLRYGEVASIEGCLEVKPVGSGLGLGTANWSIAGAGTKLAYVSGSLLVENHSRSFDAGSLSGCDYLLVSEVEPKVEGETCSEIVDGVHVEGKASGHGTRKGQSNLSVVKKSTGLTSRVGTNKVSPASSLRYVSSTGIAPLKSRSCESVSPPVRTVKHSLHGSSESGPTAHPEFPVSEWKSSLTAIGKAALDAAALGGSVLIPVSPSGATLELIEELANLSATGAPTVPIFYISPSAGELMSYTNTIPEWLSSSRLEKLYAGEALFGHVDLLQEKRLQCFRSLSSLELQRSWQEPCIVFASHWNMRIGPAAHLLYRWFQNPLCLLIVVEPNVDLKLALAPYQPMEMKAVHLPMPSCLRTHDVASVMRSVQSNFVLVPAVGRESLESIVGAAAKSVQYYEKGATIQLNKHQQQISVYMSSNQSGQGLPKEIRAGRSSATQVRGELSFKDGKWHLSALPPSQSKYQCRWGTLNLEKLLSGLKDRGLHCISMKDEVTVGLDGIRMTSREKTTVVKRSVVEIVSPYEGRIEISSKGTTIRVNDPVGRLLITQAVTSALAE